MDESITERHTLCGSQSGFTLLELLVVIAILGVLGGLAVFGVSKFRATAQKTALDQSLSTVATAVEAQMIMGNITDLRQIDPPTLDVRNAEGIYFVAFDVTADTAVLQARFKNTTDPCRQIQYPSTRPGPCDSTVGKVLTPITPGYSPSTATIAAIAKVQASDAAMLGQNTTDPDKRKNADNNDDAKKAAEKAELEKKRQAEEEAKKAAEQAELEKKKQAEEDAAKAAELEKKQADEDAKKAGELETRRREGDGGKKAAEQAELDELLKKSGELRAMISETKDPDKVDQMMAELGQINNRIKELKPRNQS